MFKFALLTESSGNIILRAVVFRISKHLFGIVIFHQFAHIKESRFIAYPGGLLHIVRYDNQGIIFLQLMKQFLNSRSGNRIKRRSRFIKQQHFGLPWPLPGQYTNAAAGHRKEKNLSLSVNP